MIKAPTKAERSRWQHIVSLGCVICGRPAMLHHCGTGMGGRKDHSRVLGLCFLHHQGRAGIHTIGRKVWRDIFGTEEQLMELTEKKLIEREKRYANA